MTETEYEMISSLSRHNNYGLFTSIVKKTGKYTAVVPLFHYLKISHFILSDLFIYTM